MGIDWKVVVAGALVVVEALAVCTEQTQKRLTRLQYLKRNLAILGQVLLLSLVVGLAEQLAGWKLGDEREQIVAALIVLPFLYLFPPRAMVQRLRDIGYGKRICYLLVIAGVVPLIGFAVNLLAMFVLHLIPGRPMPQHAAAIPAAQPSVVMR